MIYGRVLQPEEIVAKLDQVDAAALRRVARRIAKSGPPALAAVGPLTQNGGLESYDRIAARFAH
jgi:hypothetical protein